MRISPSLAFLALSGLAGVEALIPLQPRQTASRAKTQKTTSQRQAIAIPQQTSGASLPSITLAPEDTWVANLDYEGFGKEVAALGKSLLREGGQDDVEHLNKIVSWRNLAALIGIATVWTTPNPVTIAALSTWTYASWTMIAHHTCHGGYNRVDAAGFNSRGFALGSLGQRVKDWLDWMQPEAWNVEHNRLHHYRLNEDTDPDLVQRNTERIRKMDSPMLVKYARVALFMPLWKWYYYAPNTYKELQIAKMNKEGKKLPEGFQPTDPITVVSLLERGEQGEATRQVVKPMELFTQVMAPFFFSRFVFLPVALLAIPGVGPTLCTNALANLVLAEFLTNIHSFITIVTNHAGEDLYTFDDAVKPKTPSFYVRQIVGSANYAAGTDLVDFSHGFLNYQVEHHVWPDLSMLQYQKGAPKLKGICEKYGVPYVQESVWERLRKTVDIMVGKTTMRTFPTEYEPEKDKAVNGVTWKSTNGDIDEKEYAISLNAKITT
jgi:fatty acid desaturase